MSGSHLFFVRGAHGLSCCYLGGLLHLTWIVHGDRIGMCHSNLHWDIVDILCSWDMNIDIIDIMCSWDMNWDIMLI